MAPRRVVSAPVRALQDSNNKNSALIETLHVHPDVRIVSFVAAVDALPPTPVIAREQAGTLASTSRLQRTIAVGSCRIYRAPGSVAFISCGAALQPILPKSQCWAIDEHDCTFVLQIRRPTFWRIELPSTTKTDLERAKNFKKTLSEILQFEKTPCPFQRSFTIELPEEPNEPIKKIPWTPKRNANDYRPVTAGASVGENPDWTPPDTDLALRYARRPSEQGLRPLPLDFFAREVGSGFPTAQNTMEKGEPGKPEGDFSDTSTPRTTLPSDTSESDIVSSHGIEEPSTSHDENPITELIREFNVLGRGRNASHPVLSREGREMLNRQYGSSPGCEGNHTDGYEPCRRSRNSSQASFPSATSGEGRLTSDHVVTSEKHRAGCLPTQADARPQSEPEELLNITRDPDPCSPTESTIPLDSTAEQDLPKTIFTKTFSALIAPPTYLITLMLRVAAQLNPPPPSSQRRQDSSRYMQIPGQWDALDYELSE